MLSRHPTLFLAMFSWPPGCLRPFNKLRSPRFGLGAQCDGGTQWMVLSAAVNSLMVCGAREGTGSVLWSAAATNIAFAPPAQR